MTENHYEKLQVAQTASSTVIKAAYQALAKRHHPDSGSSPDEALMKQINLAWEVLADRETRQAYDRALRASSEEKTADATTDGDDPWQGDHGWGEPVAEPPRDPYLGDRGWGEAVSDPDASASVGQTPWGPPPAWAHTWSDSPPGPPDWPYAAPPSTTYRTRPLHARRIGAFAVDALTTFAIWCVVWVFLIISMSDVIDAPVGWDAEVVCGVHADASETCQSIGSTTYLVDDTVDAGALLLGALPAVVLNLVALQGMTGATIGKLVFGLRTVDRTSQLCGLRKALIRTAVGIVDLCPWILPLVGPLVVLTRPDARRLGDLAADTWVVSRSEVARPAPSH